jgi:pyruvate kinase
MEQVNRKIPIIAKIEKPQALKNLVEISETFDGLMVARGDLGVELPMEEVPFAQKKIIYMARNKAKPVIVATQMLESMIHSPIPTRAETSDCANAVLDGADSLMLSEETAMGEYPIKAVKAMRKIINKMTSHIDVKPFPLLSVKSVLTNSATIIASQVNAKLIICFTESGDAAIRLSRLRVSAPIIALTPNVEVQRLLALVWGVRAQKVKKQKSVDHLFKTVDEIILDNNYGKIGESIVIVAGVPVGVSGTLNQILIHNIGSESDLPTYYKN